jgi:tetratricopeptide (TPR) repeat protein
MRPHRSPRTARPLLVASLLALFTSSAHAQDADVQARARAHYDSAQALVSAERYLDAYAEFSAGFDLSQRPAFLFNMAECALHAGERDRARTDYGRYLERAPDGNLAETARRRLEELGPAAPAARVPTPAQTALASEPGPDRDLLTAPPLETPRELWQEEAFWIVGGTLLALAVGGAITGGVLASEANGPACGAGCVLVDLR